MSQADLQLVRDTEPGGFNLAIGEPIFLQEVYESQYPRWFEGSMGYPNLKGDPDLVKALELFHPGQKIVVTNGAKQAILAALYAIKQKNGSFRGGSTLVHQAPYWPTYPTLADLSGMNFRDQENWSDAHFAWDIRVLTAPNNPDGTIANYNRQWDIWDAAYASPVYGWNGILPWHRMSCWSAAKLYGCSGYRVGWIATGDEELATHAAEYVEKSTSGVARPSQAFFKTLLYNMARLSDEEFTRLELKARQMLMDTTDALLELGSYFSEAKGIAATRQGMFAWIKAKDPEKFMELLAKAKVKVVNGTYCGGKVDWFRISCGVTPDTMRAAVKAIKDADNG